MFGLLHITPLSPPFTCICNEIRFESLASLDGIKELLKYVGRTARFKTTLGSALGDVSYLESEEGWWIALLSRQKFTATAQNIKSRAGPMARRLCPQNSFSSCLHFGLQTSSSRHITPAWKQSCSLKQTVYHYSTHVYTSRLVPFGCTCRSWLGTWKTKHYIDGMHT